jgi:hypothetical protein
MVMMVMMMVVMMMMMIMTRLSARDSVQYQWENC